MISSVPPEIRAILRTLDDPERLLGGVLDHALLHSGATRGMVFDREHVRAVNYSHNDRVAVNRALEPLLNESYGITQSASPYFAASSDSGTPPLAIAGVLTGPPGNLAVLALERETPFSEEQIAGFAQWISLASMPVAVSLAHARLNRLARRAPLALRDLPLAELAEIPNVYELEMMLIADAMRRHQNNKVKAAQALGISREGLRRKLLRH